MGVRVLSIDGNDRTCLFDSVTDTAFGPVAEEDQIMEFLKWCAETDVPDLRTLTAAAVAQYWEQFNEVMSLVSEEE